MIQIRPELRNFAPIRLSQGTRVSPSGLDSAVRSDFLELRFQGHKSSKKTRLSEGELAERKRLEEQAPAIRNALPVVFKLWSPLPANGAGVVKYGHIAKFLTDLKQSRWYDVMPPLQKLVDSVVETLEPNELHRNETDYLLELDRIRERIASRHNYEFLVGMLANLPTGPLRDSAIEALLKKNFRYGLEALPTVSNPGMRAALTVMVQNLEDLSSLRGLENVDTYLNEVAKTREEMGVPIDPAQIRGFKSAYPRVTEGEQACINSEHALPSAEKPITLAPFFKEALAPYLDCGFSLTEAPEILFLMSRLGMDEGELTTEVIPAYKRFAEFALRRPDKFVKAGQPLPSADKIRAMLHRDGIQLLKAIILLGEAPLKNALDMKRLPTVLKHSATVLGHRQETVTAVSKLSRQFVDPYDSLKLLDFLACLKEKTPISPEMEAALDQMAASRQPDIKVLGKAFLKNILAHEVLKDVTISDEQVDKWNLTYLNTLASAIKNMNEENRTELLAVCKAALEGRYPEYLHDPNTELGQSNLKTKAAFEHEFLLQGIELDYDQWLHYPGQLEFTRPAKHTLEVPCREAANRFIQETLQQNPTRREDILKWLRSIDLELQGDFWATRLGSGKSSVTQYTSLATMNYYVTGLDEKFTERAAPLLSLVKRLEEMPEQEQRLKIELWKREPGHDLFLGNYTGACIALDNYGSGESSIHANQNTFVQVAYVKNPETDKVVGKALFYFAKDLETDLPIMVLNTYEGRGDDNDGTYEECPVIRENLVKFAKDYSRAVLGRAVPLYTGTTLNPLYMDDLPSTYIDMSVVGSANKDRFYLDSLPDSEGPVSGSHYRVEMKLLDPGDPDFSKIPSEVAVEDPVSQKRIDALLSS